VPRLGLEIPRTARPRITRYINSSIKERVTSIVQPHGETDSNKHRDILRRTGLQMIRTHPLLGLGPEVWRILSKCHDMRNRTEYEGVLDVDERLVLDLIGACRKVAAKVRSLPPIQEQSK